MYLERLVQEKGWESLSSVQEKVDVVLDYLHEEFWANKEREIQKTMVHAVIRRQDYLREHTSIIAEKALNSKGMENSPENRAKLEQELCEVLNAVRPRSEKEKAEINDGESNALGRLSEYFGKPEEAKYSGEDVLELGFLPHSCTSFAILAFDLLRTLGVECEVIYCRHSNSREDSSGHSVLRYVTEDGKTKKCDPKWQRCAKFFEGHPDEKEKFVNDPDYLVHGRYGTRYASSKVIRSTRKTEG